MASKEKGRVNKKSISNVRSLHRNGDSLNLAVPQIQMATVVQQTKLDPGSLTPADLQRLQRTIGNQAVRQLLAGKVQRQPVTDGSSAKARERAPEGQIQRKFVEKREANGRYKEVGLLNSKVSEASEAAEDASMGKKFIELYMSADYYDIDTWDSEKGTAQKVDASLVGEQEEAPAEIGQAEEQEVVLPSNVPEFIGDYAPKYVEEQGVNLRDLTTKDEKRSSVQVVMHALSEGTQAEKKDPAERLQTLAGNIEKAASAREKVGGETLTVFIAPEGYFGRLSEMQNMLYSEKEYQYVVSELQKISRKYPNILIVGGAIHWKKEPAEDPGHKAGLYQGPEQVPEKHTAYTYVTSPVVHDGEVFLYNKHVATGGETNPKAITQKMFMATHKEKVAQSPGETVGFFKVGGLNIGIEICGDYSYSVLRTALDKLFKEKVINVDYHVLIAAGQTPTANAGKSSLKGNGWVIGVDQPNAKRRNYSVLEFKQGKIVQSEMQHLTQHVEGAGEQEQPKELKSGRTVVKAKGDDLIVLEGVLKKIGGN